LLHVLQERLGRIPVAYRLHAVFVDPGFGGSGAEVIESWCREHGVALHVERTRNGPLAHSDDNRENPCFLCARMRRQRIFETADTLGCNKIALGHHQDDLIETFLMNILYAGETSTMRPCQPFFEGRFTVIRPLALTPEATIRRFAREAQLPAITNPCPSADRSKRRQVKRMLEDLYRGNRKIRGNLFRAMGNVRPDYLLTPPRPSGRGEE
jgi:tRNA 2-thiocytidine biosynthesis protein TtcA